MSELDPEFKEHLSEALSEVAAGDIGPLTADRELAELGLDSISISEMVIVLEDKQDIDIDASQLAGLSTFGDLQDLVQKMTAEAR